MYPPRTLKPHHHLPSSSHHPSVGSLGGTLTDDRHALQQRAGSAPRTAPRQAEADACHLLRHRQLQCVMMEGEAAGGIGVGGWGVKIGVMLCACVCVEEGVEGGTSLRRLMLSPYILHQGRTRSLLAPQACGVAGSHPEILGTFQLGEWR